MNGSTSHRTSRVFALIVSYVFLSVTGSAQGSAEPATPAQGQTGAPDAARPAEATLPQAGEQPAGAAPGQRAPGGAPPSEDALRMGSPPELAPGTTEQSMWPAASADGWSKPVLIPWQRSFDDALRVSRATGKPVLVAVNMDGEIASEHWAGVRYREPETARLFEPYVCIAASVYRHTPRDHDEQGRRIPCPRLGTVTCGEHIAAETELYEKYFDGMRISPRHIMLEPDGTKSYDVYFSWDTATVVTALRKGVENRPPPKPQGDMPLVERTQSPDVLDRMEIESEYQRATPEIRRALLEAVLVRREVDQVDLLRLAIFGLDLELARVARRALAQSETEAAVDLIAEALKSPLAADERALLIEASARLARKFPRAQTLTALHQGLEQTSKWVDTARWPAIEYEARARAAGALDSRPSLEARAAESDARPEDPAARLDLAESLLARALDPSTEPGFAKLLADDARGAARAARELGAQGWRLEAVLAVTSTASGDRDAARAHAVKAIEGGMLRADGATTSSDVIGERTGLRVLALFAEARQAAIRQAYRAKTPWAPEWLADINAAYALIAKHPLATDENLVAFYDFLRWLGGTPRANAVLDDALARFPSSAVLHDRLRARMLWEAGPAGLEAAYAERLTKDAGATPDFTWFAGYAALVAAEHQRRAGSVDDALAAYGRAIDHFERYLVERPELRASADHFVALALAGRARIALERGDLALATREILASFAREPAAGASPDGLNLTPVDTAKMLREKLEAEQRADLAAKLQSALDALDPRLLEKRPFELENPRPRRSGSEDRSREPR